MAPHQILPELIQMIDALLCPVILCLPAPQPTHEVFRTVWQLPAGHALSNAGLRRVA